MEPKKEIFITKSFDETQKLGESFIKNPIKSEKALVICLYGDLGSGKTTFTQGIARGLGISRRIISPTFNIVRLYKIDLKSQISKLKTKSQNSKIFYHIDLYRMENFHEIDALGIKEIINNPNNIVVIEWAQKLGNLLPKERIDIDFEYLGEEERRITIKIKSQRAKIKDQIKTKKNDL
ncbi:tRNA (adenosine(37)-N6)-threonylcarbamoyltransferase complex ATPase subunit type 1 TsaE [Candidatus Microgenomates bacterium]|nr:MAG: tRNA (adenosine(37)-N6)-threonylcarbamoyltransferase complex ATPase subunit type 1 TsaE [Candidatus Microgenomates bacterium]